MTSTDHMAPDKAYQALEIRKVGTDLELPLGEFLLALAGNGDSAFFHPHPLDQEAARRIAGYKGKDLYYIVLLDQTVVGYGLLRGWDEGYQIPSLGIAIHPSMRGKGIGKMLMNFLHTASYLRGSPKIRLKVYPENQDALIMYKQLGYEFAAELEDNQLVGYYTFSG